jgi:hypothetical protein
VVWIKERCPHGIFLRKLPGLVEGAAGLGEPGSWIYVKEKLEDCDSRGDFSSYYLWIIIIRKHHIYFIKK